MHLCGVLKAIVHLYGINICDASKTTVHLCDINSGILSGKEKWQRVAEMIRSFARMELGETSEKLACKVDERSGGGTRMSRRN